MTLAPSPRTSAALTLAMSVLLAMGCDDRKPTAAPASGNAPAAATQAVAAPVDAAAETARGKALLLSGDVDGALARFNAAIRAAPDDPAARLLRADAYARKREYDLAIADL